MTDIRDIPAAGTGKRLALNSRQVAALLNSPLRPELLAVLRALTADNADDRLAYSPDEAARVLGISRELTFDLLRTGQLKSVKAGRRRLISRANINAFLAGDAA